MFFPWGLRAAWLQWSLMLGLAGLMLFALGCGPETEASTDDPPEEPSLVAVKYREGTVHGFLVLKDTQGNVLAHGDQVQTVQGDTVNSRMMFEFPDGSVLEERVTYTQDGVFRLDHYAKTVRGPSFEQDIDISFDATTGRYSVTTTPQGGQSEHYRGTIEVPAAIYNGMVSIIAKNILDRPAARVRYVAFTPEPRVVELLFVRGETRQIRIGPNTRQARHFVVKPKLGLFLGVAAALLDKTPPDNHVWIVTDYVPGFVRAEAPFAPEGPMWRIELTSPDWPKEVGQW